MICFSSSDTFTQSSPDLVFSASFRGRTLITTFTFEDEIGESVNYKLAFEILG